MNSNLVYILFEYDNMDDPVGVYSSRQYAESDAMIMRLQDWYILAREYK